MVFYLKTDFLGKLVDKRQRRSGDFGPGSTASLSRVKPPVIISTGMALFRPSLETSYGSLALFSSILHNLFLLYHMDMFVSIYRIDKLSFWIGEALFLVWNSLNDPLFGWISDRNLLRKTKHEDTIEHDIVNMRLSRLQLYGPLFSVVFVLFWFKWMWTGLQFAVCLCLYDSFLTMIDLHHSSLLADLAVSAEGRTKFSSRNSLFSAAGSTSVFLSYLVWNKASLFNFRIFCISLAFVSFVGFFFMAKLMKTRFLETALSRLPNKSFREESMEPSSTNQEATVKHFGKQLLSHKNLKWFAFMNLVQVFHCHFNSNFFPLFIEALLGGAVSPAVASGLLGLSFVAPHINNLYFLSLCWKYSSYTVIKGLFWVKMIISILMYFAGFNHVWILCFFILSNRVFTEGTCKLLSLVITDLVDEDMVLHHRPQAVSALIFGTTALLSKPGQTLAPLIGTWMLATLTGHDIFESAESKGSVRLDIQSLGVEQQQSYRRGVFLLLVTVPVICAILQLGAWSKFTLRGQRLAQVKASRQSSLTYQNV